MQPDFCRVDGGKQVQWSRCNEPDEVGQSGSHKNHISGWGLDGRQHGFVGERRDASHVPDASEVAHDPHVGAAE
eukprot:11039603-Lingulodinium_polyedra.AAC.1